MLSNNERVIAVIGATGQQGGSVVRALQAASSGCARSVGIQESIVNWPRKSSKQI